MPRPFQKNLASNSDGRHSGFASVPPRGDAFDKDRDDDAEKPRAARFPARILLEMVDRPGEQTIDEEHDKNAPEPGHLLTTPTDAAERSKRESE